MEKNLSCRGSVRRGCVWSGKFASGMCLVATSTPAQLFAIRGSQKRGPGTLQTRD